MRLKITLSKENFSLPIAYHTVIQGVIYSLLQKSGSSNFYHDEGFRYKQKVFKCFTFSRLFGKYKVENGYLVFEKDFYFYLSAQDTMFLQDVYDTLSKQDYLKINHDNVYIKKIDIIELKPFSKTKEITIQTLSPMLIYTTSDNYSNYYKPSQKESTKYIIQNIIDKSNAYGYPINNVVFKIKKVIYEKKCMVKYKDCIYRAYLAKMVIETNYDTLLFIYNTGLSSKGSCGFGMIEVIREKGRLSI